MISAALLGVGIAMHGDAKGKLGSLEARVVSDALVNALGEEDLAKFEVVDMVDALDRVAGANREARIPTDYSK